VIVEPAPIYVALMVRILVLALVVLAAAAGPVHAGGHWHNGGFHIDVGVGIVAPYVSPSWRHGGRRGVAQPLVEPQTTPRYHSYHYLLGLSNGPAHARVPVANSGPRRYSPHRIRSRLLDGCRGFKQAPRACSSRHPGVSSRPIARVQLLPLRPTRVHGVGEAAPGRGHGVAVAVPVIGSHSHAVPVGLGR
jgi:hypothetical protein